MCIGPQSHKFAKQKAAKIHKIQSYETSNKHTNKKLFAEYVTNGFQFGKEDSRIELDKSCANYPYNCIGLIVLNSYKKYIIGTGFLVGKNLVLTCAHHFFSKADVFSLYFYPKKQQYAKDGIKIIAYKFKNQYSEAQLHRMANIKAIQQPFYTNLKQKDFALLKLQKNVELTEGYLQLCCIYPQADKLLQIYGYPVNKLNNKLKSNLWGAKKKESFQKKGMIYYDIDATGGQGGSPIFIREGSKICTIGIHIGCSLDSLQSAQFGRYNYGLLFSKYIFQQLKKWQFQLIGANKGDQNSIVLIQTQQQLIKQLAKYPEIKLVKKQLNQKNINLIKAHYQKITTRINAKYTFAFYWDTTPSYSNRFRVFLQRVLKKKKNDKTYLISSKQILPKIEKHSVLFQIINQGGNWAMAFGIISSQQKYNQFISNDSKNGILFHAGKQIQYSLNIDNHQTEKWLGRNKAKVPQKYIEMIVDLQNWMIQFIRYNKQFQKIDSTQAVIPIHLHNCDLYIGVELTNYLDEISIIN